MKKKLNIANCKRLIVDIQISLQEGSIVRYTIKAKEDIVFSTKATTNVTIAYQSHLLSDCNLLF